MKVYKFNPPYQPNGRTTYPETSKKAGVYLIKENNKLVYVGFSGSDLYRTMYRHFQEWTDKNYSGGKARSPVERVTYKSKMKRNSYTVRIIYCTAAQAMRLEKMLIIKHQPRDNEMKYDSYQVDLYDTRIINEYQETPVSREAPF